MGCRQAASHTCCPPPPPDLFQHLVDSPRHGSGPETFRAVSSHSASFGPCPCPCLGESAGCWDGSERTACSLAAQQRRIKAGEGKWRWFLLAAAQLNVGGGVVAGGGVSPAPCPSQPFQAQDEAASWEWDGGRESCDRRRSPRLPPCATAPVAPPKSWA